MNFRTFLQAAVAASALFAGAAFAQTTPTTTPTTPTVTNEITGVLVYELNFKHMAGFNVDFYDGGFVVVPATGSSKGSVIFTATDNGRKLFRSFEGAVSFFPARSKDNRYSVMSMTGTTSANVSMQAFGKAEGEVTVETPTMTLTLKAAETLRGIAQASLDENGKTTINDRTVGFVEYSEMKLNLDSKETSKANKKAQSVGTTFTALKTMLTARGYVDAVPATTPTPTPGTSTGNPLGGTTPIGGGVTNP